MPGQPEPIKNLANVTDNSTPSFAEVEAEGWMANGKWQRLSGDRCNAARLGSRSAAKLVGTVSDLRVYSMKALLFVELPECGMDTV